MSHFECDSCGACCGTFPIFASAEDDEREPRIAEEGKELAPWLQTPEWKHQLYPLPFHEACAFLDSSKRCDIYPTRPNVCRRFTAGSDQCQEARRRQGIEALRADTCVAD